MSNKLIVLRLTELELEVLATTLLEGRRMGRLGFGKGFDAFDAAYDTVTEHILDAQSKLDSQGAINDKT